MDRERWTNYYISVQNKNQKFYLKVVHYDCFVRRRQWYRIFAEGYKIDIPLSEQLFGFGRTFDEALDKLFKKVDEYEASN